MKLHEKIAYYRKRSGMSQEALAELLGVSRQAVSKWETGDSQPELANLLSMAQVFGVTTDHLLCDSDVPKAEKQESAYTTADHPRVKPCLKALSRSFKKYGWLMGLYVAFSGVPMLIVGGIMRAIESRSDDMFSGFGHVVAGSASMVSTPMEIISAVVLGIGCVMILGGIILAVYLKKKLK